MEYKKTKIQNIGIIVSGATPKTTVSDNFGGDIAWVTPADLSGYEEKYISRNYSPPHTLVFVKT
jgi:type I restriction enzyme S subunit